MAVSWVVAGDKILKVVEGQGISLQCEMNVGSEVIYPESLRPRLLAGGFSVKEQDIRLHTLGVEYARGQPQQSSLNSSLTEVPGGKSTREAGLALQISYEFWHKCGTFREKREHFVAHCGVQGDFIEHASVLRQLETEALSVRLPQELDGLDGLIIPVRS